MKPVTLIAISVFFSAWGDRLWTFAVGLYLVKLTPGSLQLTAIYGLVLTSTAFIFSPIIGNWIDSKNRLKAVRLLLILQNTFVLIDGIIILVYLFNMTASKHVLQIMQALIIVFGSVANLAGQGEKICITKDWIVVICRNDGRKLAKANTLLRQIDLSVAIVAPVGVGFLMSFISDLAGIVFICSWNVITMIVEYLLLLRVYKGDVELNKLPRKKDTADDVHIVANDVEIGTENAAQIDDNHDTTNNDVIRNNDANNSGELSPTDNSTSNFKDLNQSTNESDKKNKNEGFDVDESDNTNKVETQNKKETNKINGDNFDDSQLDDVEINTIDFTINSHHIINTDGVTNDIPNDKDDVNVAVTSFQNLRRRTLTASSSQLGQHTKSKLKKFTTGWRVYKKQPVFLSGLALSALYITVLGFNAITSSFAYSQGLAEVFVSICFGFGSLVGISGTFLFPRIRNRVGLFRSAIIGNIIQLTFLTLCVISIWLPGSPSDLSTKDAYNASTPAVAIIDKTNASTTIKPVTSETKSFGNISIIVLMVGIILSRAGLWVADLSITQIQQEYVSEGERGAVGGGQYALNSLFDLLHFIITIFLPYPRQFWILILMSAFAVVMSFTINLLAFCTVPKKLIKTHSDEIGQETEATD